MKNDQNKNDDFERQLQIAINIIYEDRVVLKALAKS